MKKVTDKNSIIIIVSILVVLLIISIIIYNNRKQSKLWEQAKVTNTSESYQKYLESYPDGEYKITADSMYDQALWKEAVDSSFFEVFQSYINKRPKGIHTDEAKKIMQKSNELPSLNGFSIGKKELLIFKNHERFLIVGISKRIDESSVKTQLIIYRCNNKKILTNESIWKIAWKSPVEEAYKYESLYVLNTDKAALILSGYNNGGAYGLSSYFVVKFDDNGKITPDTQIEGVRSQNVIKKDKTLTIIEDCKRTDYQVVNDIISQKITLRSDMAPAGAVKATFKVTDSQEITSTNRNEFELKVGQSIAFIPSNQSTRDAFNAGDISIFTDAWHENGNGNGISTCEGDRVSPGNSFKFDKEGIFHFLIYNDQNPSIYSTDYTENYEPTFTVRVSSPASQSSNRVQTTNQSTSSNTQTNTTKANPINSKGYERTSRDYFTCESAVHEFLSRHSFVSRDGSRLSYSIGQLTISYNGGRLQFTNIQVRVQNRDEAIILATDLGSGVKMRIYLNSAQGSIVDMNDNNAFQAIN